MVSASLTLPFFESSSKLFNFLARSLPIGIARIAVKLERTSAQRSLKLIPGERDRLVVIIWAGDLEVRRCRHSAA
jgi:flagellar motor switch protein FliG